MLQKQGHFMLKKSWEMCFYCPDSIPDITILKKIKFLNFFALVENKKHNFARLIIVWTPR